MVDDLFWPFMHASMENDRLCIQYISTMSYDTLKDMNVVLLSPSRCNCFYPVTTYLLTRFYSPGRM